MEGCIFSGVLVENRVGYGRRIVAVGHRNTEGVSHAAAISVAGDHIEVQGADMRIEGRAAEGAGGRIETEPGGQGTTAGQLRAVGQGVADVDIIERVGGELEVEGCIFSGALVGDRVGHRGCIVGVGHDQVEGVAHAAAVAVVGDHFDAQGADMCIERRAAEGAGDRIEAEPGGQGATAGQLHAVGQGVADVDVVEGIGGELEVEGCIFSGVLVENRVGHRGRIVAVGHDYVECIGHAAAVAVVGDHIDAHAADMRIQRRAAEGAGDRVEIEPGGQGATAGQLRAVGQGVADVHIVERVGSELEVEGCIFSGVLVGDRVGHGRGIVHRHHGNAAGNRQAGAIDPAVGGTAIVGDACEGNGSRTGSRGFTSVAIAHAIDHTLCNSATDTPDLVQGDGRGAAGQADRIANSVAGGGAAVAIGQSDVRAVDTQDFAAAVSQVADGQVQAADGLGRFDRADADAAEEVDRAAVFRVGGRAAGGAEGGRVVDCGDCYGRCDTGCRRIVAAAAVGDLGNGNDTTVAAWVVAAVAVADAIEQRAHLSVVADHAAQADGGGAADHADAVGADPDDGAIVAVVQRYAGAADVEGFRRAVADVAYSQRRTAKGLAAVVGSGSDAAKQIDRAAVLGEGGVVGGRVHAWSGQRNNGVCDLDVVECYPEIT